MASTSARLRSAPDQVPKAALAVFVATGVGYLLSVYIEAGNVPFTANYGNNSGDTVFGTISFGLAVLGLFIVAFRPGHRTGWLLLAFGLTMASGLLAHALAIRLLLVEDPAYWLGYPFAWATNWLIAAALGLVLFVPATWPTGRIEARWLRWFAAAALTAWVTVVVAQAFSADSLDGLVAPATIDNPLGIEALDSVVNVVTPIAVVTLLAFFVTSIIDLAVRSIRASGGGLVLALGLSALVLLAFVGVALGSVVSSASWLLVVVVLSFFGIGVLVVLAARAQRRGAVAEEARTRLVAEREDERRRLRADLHDGLGPLIAALGLELDAPDSPGSRDRARALLDEAISEIRRISRNLRPATLDELGLVGALRRQADALTEAGGPTIDVVTDPEQLPALSASVEVAAYRIAGEAMTNAARHSGAGRCRVTLDATAQDGSFQVEIADDGAGVTRSRPGGLGLASMRDRAQELGGSVDIGPGPDGGTRVVAVLPVGA